MKKVLFSLALVVAGTVGFAQKGNNAIGVGVDLGIPTGDFDAYNVGIGGSVKGLLGVGSAGQATLTVGFTSHKFDIADWEFRTAVIPFLVGYRHNFSGFYVEPQAGYASLSTKVDVGGDDTKDSEGAFTWATAVGYQVKGFDLSARYQSSHPDGGSASLIGFRVGYNFSLKGKAKSSDKK